MSNHRIFGSEADQPRPLAYVSMFPANRRRYRGLVTAAVIGGVLVLAAAILVVVTGASVGAPIH
jgi:hypothetical protein